MKAASFDLPPKLAARREAFRHELLEAALRYADRGYPVFPVRGDKRPLVKWKDGATTDHRQIRTWWARWPFAMIGMPTGARSGVVVLDVDRKNGVDGLANLRAAGVNPFTWTPIVAHTPSGGLHFFMRYTGEVKNSAGMLAAGVDLRGDGGMIVLPPSIRDVNDLSTQEYCWEYHDARL